MIHRTNMDMEDIAIKHNKADQKFEMNTQAGDCYIQYELTSSNIIRIIHTCVPPVMQGGGGAAGARLVKRILEYAKDNNQEIKPVCSFVTEYIEKNPEYKFLVNTKHY